MSRTPVKSVTLDKAIDSYLTALAGEGASRSTMQAKRHALTVLAQAVGRKNRSVRKLTDDDFRRCLSLLKYRLTPEEVAAKRDAGEKPHVYRLEGSMEASRAALRGFVRYLVKEEWVKPSFDPLYRVIKPAKDDVDPDRKWKGRHVPFEEWAALLDAAGKHHPRTRMIVAAGLFWGNRCADLSLIQIKHLNLDRGMDENGEPLPGMVELWNKKRGRATHNGLVIGPWARQELDLYLDWYRETYGELDPDWYLLPAKFHVTDLRVINALDTVSWPVDPARSCGPRYVREDTQTALALHGWTEDMLLGEGGHTLRRSFAVAMEELGDAEAAQAGLDHETTAMTMKYTRNRKGYRKLNEVAGSLTRPGEEPPADAIPQVRVPAQSTAPLMEQVAEVVDLAAWRAKRTA